MEKKKSNKKGKKKIETFFTSLGAAAKLKSNHMCKEKIITK